MAKRTFDLVFAGLSLFLLLPLLLLIVLAIAVDTAGPPVVARSYLGRHMRPFRLYRFRTRTGDAQSAMLPEWARRDPVYTRVGLFLEQTGLADLPQLWNVLKGDMSVVGPRVALPSDIPSDEDLAAEFARRFAVRPGLTGLSQINRTSAGGASPAAFGPDVRLDLWYVENRSLLLDLKIVMRTVPGDMKRMFDKVE